MSDVLRCSICQSGDPNLVMEGDEPKTECCKADYDVICAECDSAWTDMGGGVSCDDCGEGPLPFVNDKGEVIDTFGEPFYKVGSKL